MNNKRFSVVSEWIDQDVGENRSILFSEEDCEGLSNMITDGVKKDVKLRLGENLDSTFDLSHNEPDNKEFFMRPSSRLPQSIKPIETLKSLEAISGYRRRPKSNTFYQYIWQYKGIVQSVNEEEETFTANLVNIDNEDEILQIEFGIHDYHFGSDEELIRPGASFVWIMGQEVENGTARNTTKFLFRRTPVLRGKALLEAGEDAKDMAALFRGIEESETIS